MGHMEMEHHGGLRAWIRDHDVTPAISVAEPSAPSDRPNDWYDSAEWQNGYATVLSESLPQTRQRAYLASQLPRNLRNPRTIFRSLLSKRSEPTRPMEFQTAYYRDWKR